MGIYITGDIHGDALRFLPDSFYEQLEFKQNEENYMIICGDFGLIWDEVESERESLHLKWLEELPFTILFVDGNHENFTRLDKYPVKEWHGGKVHEIRSNIFHLMRGEIFEIEGKKIFAFGGASSHDISDGIIEKENWQDVAMEMYAQGKRMIRVRDVSWWDRELPNQEELENGLRNLESNNWKVDYVITHTPPASIIALLGQGFYKQDLLTKYLEDKVRSKLVYDKWFMGHMHLDRQINTNDVLLYEQIVRVH